MRKSYISYYLNPLQMSLRQYKSVKNALSKLNWKIELNWTPTLTISFQPYAQHSLLKLQISIWVFWTKPNQTVKCDIKGDCICGCFLSSGLNGRIHPTDWSCCGKWPGWSRSFWGQILKKHRGELLPVRRTRWTWMNEEKDVDFLTVAHHTVKDVLQLKDRNLHILRSMWYRHFVDCTEIMKLSFES